MDVNDNTRALDIEIAKALGYTVKKQRSGYWHLIDPQGKEVKVPAFSQTQALGFVPHYSTDANAALTLVDDLPINLQSAPTIGWGEQREKWRAEIPVAGSEPQYDDTPALAICRAWLAWKRAASESTLSS